MKSTYAAPAAISRGDVVKTTLSDKPLVLDEINPTHRPDGGGNLSFGL